MSIIKQIGGLYDVQTKKQLKKLQKIERKAIFKILKIKRKKEVPK